MSSPAKPRSISLALVRRAAAEEMQAARISRHRGGAPRTTARQAQILARSRL